ncbi:MAG: hypothetical protein ACI8R4_003694 [Paracoccaceae bacterium]|jgi:uncharacterized membrane protein YqiK
MEKARLQALPGILSEMVKPAEKIKSINIHHLSGAGIGGGSEGSAGREIEISGKLYTKDSKFRH